MESVQEHSQGSFHSRDSDRQRNYSRDSRNDRNQRNYSRDSRQSPRNRTYSRDQLSNPDRSRQGDRDHGDDRGGNQYAQDSDSDSVIQFSDGSFPDPPRSRQASYHEGKELRKHKPLNSGLSFLVVTKFATL